MKTIKERAENFKNEIISKCVQSQIDNSEAIYAANVSEIAYEEGANDQHKIDKKLFDVMLSSANESFKKYFIANAWKWITETCSKYPITKEELPILEPTFYKAMEE